MDFRLGHPPKAELPREALDLVHHGLMMILGSQEVLLGSDSLLDQSPNPLQVRLGQSQPILGLDQIQF